MLVTLDLVGVGVVITSFGTAAAAIIAAVASTRTHTVASETRDAVKMSDGQTIGNVTEANEGRRIVATIPPADQTAQERSYVEKLPPDTAHIPEATP